MALEWILIWKNLQQTTKYSILTDLQHYPSVPKTSEKEKERETKEKIREKILPVLGRALIRPAEAGGPGLGGHPPRGLPTPLLHHSGTCHPLLGEEK